MADGWGGKRKGSGRKPKAEEEEVKAALAMCRPRAHVMGKLGEAIDKGESWAITLYVYMDLGKPKERIDLRTGKILDLDFENGGHDGAVADIAGAETRPEADRSAQGAD